MQKAAVLVGVPVMIAALDLASKTLATNLLAHAVWPILPGLQLALGFNRGISFGLLVADGLVARVALLVLSILAIAVLVRFAWRAEYTMERLSLAAILGGAFGNFVDRLVDGAVTDFIDLHIGSWHFPTFNLADISISVGVAGIVYAAYQTPRSAV